MISKQFRYDNEKVPDEVEWYANEFFDPKSIVELCQRVGFNPFPIKIGVLSDYWRGHMPGSTVLSQFNRFVVIEEYPQDYYSLIATRRLRKGKEIR